MTTTAEELAGAVERLRDWANNAYRGFGYDGILADLRALLDERGKLRETLAFYANKENWREITPPEHDRSGTISVRSGGINLQASAGKRLGPALVDFGEKARASIGESREPAAHPFPAEAKGDRNE